MYPASACNTSANIFFKVFTGRLCAVFAPSGAVATLASAITTNAGR
jgi:hypothetical protein